MSTRENFRQAIDDQVRQEKFIGVAQHNKAIAKAVETYSKHRPRVRVVDQGGVGTHAALLFVLEGWDDEFSMVRSVEYPVDDAKAAKTVLSPEEWTVYQAPDGKELHLLDGATIAEGAPVRITFTAIHVVDEQASTIPAKDETAVQALAAAYFCRILSAAYAEGIDPNINADSVDQLSKRREYESLAKAFEREFTAATGLTPGQPGPAAAVADWDLNLSNGRDRITHPRRFR